MFPLLVSSLQKYDWKQEREQDLHLQMPLSSPFVLLLVAAAAVFSAWTLAYCFCRAATTSGITASINDKGSIGCSDPSYKRQWNQFRVTWLGTIGNLTCQIRIIVYRVTALLHPWTVYKTHCCRYLKTLTFAWFTSLRLISASVYWSPFCMMLSRAAGGTKAPFILDWLMWLSIPNVYAECVKPAVKTNEQL